jgi:hypothetical protein
MKVKFTPPTACGNSAGSWFSPYLHSFSNRPLSADELFQRSITAVAQSDKARLATSDRVESRAVTPKHTGDHADTARSA